MFTNSTSGSVICVDVEIHENIDYDFFESVNDTNVPQSQILTEEEQKDKKSNLKVNKSFHDEISTNLKTIESKQKPTNENTGSTVRFSAVTESDNVGEKCLEIEPVSTKQEKCTKLKELMNCVAYGERKESQEEEEDDDKIESSSPDFLSLSTDTTSEITNVTTRPSSSGCSSMAKCDSEDYFIEKQETDLLNNLQKADNIGCSSMKLLLDALDSFEKQEIKSTTSSVLSAVRRHQGRRNMSFTNQQLRKIDRENEILIKKLENLKKSRPKPASSMPASCVRLTSSAINRKRQQRKIEHDNMILLKKIETAKPSASIAISSLRR